MSISFFIVGGVIFSIYIFLMVWNIKYSHDKQKKENYPEVDDKKKLHRDSNSEM